MSYLNKGDPFEAVRLIHIWIQYGGHHFAVRFRSLTPNLTLEMIIANDDATIGTHNFWEEVSTDNII